MSFYTSAMNASTAEYYPTYTHNNEYKYHPQYEMNYQNQPTYTNAPAFQNETYHPQQYTAPSYYQEQQYQYYPQQAEQPENVQAQHQYHYFNYAQQQQPQQQPQHHQSTDQFFNNIQPSYVQQQQYKQMIYPGATFEQQNFYKQEVINTKEEFENSCHDSEKDENQSITYSPVSPNPHRDSSNSISQSPSSINLKTEEILPCSPKQNTKKSSASGASKKTKKVASESTTASSSSLEKTKQSISKNNIRNFLTPIVRMRSGYVDYQLLEKEKLTTLQYDAFLKEHFYMPGQTRLNIRQTIFDSLLDPQEKTQLKEKKVFAMIVIKKIQEQFMRLILEKRSTFSDQEFKQQFEWINGINETLVEFLNSFSN